MGVCAMYGASTTSDATYHAVVLEQIYKTYGKVPALRGVSLQIEEGVILGLVGPNGAGKTTMLRILCGVLRPDSGVVRIRGLNVRDNVLKAKRLIGYLPDLPLLHEELVVLDTLRMFGRLWSVDLGRARVLRILAEYGLESAWNRRVGTLSKGQKQRLSLACALLHNPPVLLLDEPFTGLDVESREFIRSKIDEMARSSGKTVVVSSHDLGDVEKLCTMVALMAEGRVLTYGSTDHIRKQAIGNVFRVELADRPPSLDGLSAHVEEYSVAGATIVFRLRPGDNANAVLKFLVERDCPIRAFAPLGLEETLLELIKGSGASRVLLDGNAASGNPTIKGVPAEH